MAPELAEALDALRAVTRLASQNFKDGGTAEVTICTAGNGRMSASARLPSYLLSEIVEHAAESANRSPRPPAARER